MVELQIVSGKKAGTKWSARHFPFTVGRSSAADLQVEEPGMWDKHFEVCLERPNFVLKTCNQGLVSVNGTQCESTVLKSGDLIEVGALKIRFGLTNVPQKTLIVREFLTWTALGILCVAQIVLIYWLNQ